MAAADYVGYGVTFLAALLSSAGLFELFDRRRLKRETARIEQAKQAGVDMQAITGSATILVQELQEELRDHRAKAEKLHDRLVEWERRTVRLTSEVDMLSHRIRVLIGWIHDPSMSMAMLRGLVPQSSAPPPSASNGHTP
jgi:hypothetical protein